MSNVTVIYAQGTKVIRRINVSDDDVPRAIAGPGETALAVPFDTYSQSNDAQLRAYVASKIGAAGPDRCVEVDAKGRVVAIYHADPVLDRPFSSGNVMELHALANVGNVRINNAGEFIAPDAITVPDKSTIVAALKKDQQDGKLNSALTDSELAAMADNVITDVSAKKQKADSAIAYLASVAESAELVV